MSYIAKCIYCDCPIYMEDDFDENDDRSCEECRDDVERFRALIGKQEFTLVIED